MTPIQGLIVPTVTPYTSGGQPDYATAERLTHFYGEQGVAALFPGGTTGEFALLSISERKALLEAVMNAARPHQLKVIAHTGAATLAEVLDLSRHAQQAGADAVAVVTPFYYGYEETELEDFYRQVCRALPDLGVYAYTIPQRAGNNFAPAAVGRLLSEPNFRGIKDSSGDMHRLLHLIDVPGLSVLAGADDLAYPFLLSGGHGLVSGPGGVVPELFQAFFEALPRDLLRAQRLVKHIRTFSRIIRGGGRIDYLKAGLDWRGFANGPSRFPLPNLSETERRALYAELDTFASAMEREGIGLRQLIA
ncbi:dihydrodipicolinate synthase family protein [Deinococcus irradiatisoli]|uniref:Dihydrodipicolinate synthase family protein n=1 Tax=Deinococcus irradiatisoli TaxID=2202254 RepID=A0A2Z3JA47_9DEIO|nr:dihydrodipicolinate synthase family protein [Deinococcus irradiatisoli]AWN21987.1 dihydrodipicolinate synthase family protein [Deinococcus irradiatisoli]